MEVVCPIGRDGWLVMMGKLQVQCMPPTCSEEFPPNYIRRCKKSQTKIAGQTKTYVMCNDIVMDLCTI